MDRVIFQLRSNVKWTKVRVVSIQVLRTIRDFKDNYLIGTEIRNKSEIPINETLTIVPSPCKTKGRQRHRI